MKQDWAHLPMSGCCTIRLEEVGRVLALMKTCRKLGVPFFTYLGHRLGVEG